MRKILFKAKELSDGRWVKGSLVKTPFGTFIEWYEDSICNKREVNSGTVCQSTGFLDKNGKEVYESDVLRSDNYPFSCVEDNAYDNYYGILGWSEQTAVFYIETVVNPKASVSGISHGNCDYISQDLLSDFEVIGSVHDKEWQEKLKLKPE